MKISGKIIDLHARSIFMGELVIESGRIKEVYPVKTASGGYIMPGFVDAHVHIESSMTSPARFAEAIVPHGTLGVVTDPHEIANVLGIEGVEYMINDSKGSPVCFAFGAPSCVPATPFETSGASLGQEEVEKLLERKEIGFLSEVMNFPGVINKETSIVAKINSAIRRNKPVDGHAPGLTGNDLEKYVGAGISTDHECSKMSEAVEKIKLGMKVLIREGSAARNLDALRDLLKSYPDKVMLCSDDLHPEMLIKGHINILVRRLLNGGYDLFDVLRSCTVNPVKHYGLDLGLLRQDDPADFIIINDLSEMKVSHCYRKGELIFSEGRNNFKVNEPVLVNKFDCSLIRAGDIEVKRAGTLMRVLTAIDGELLTGSEWADAGTKEYAIQNTDADILKLVVKNRYDDSPPACGFVKGFGLKRGAFASSVAHDSHNLICVGVTDDEIVSAMNELIRLRGGLAVCDGSSTESLQLNIGGLMSGRPVAETAASYERLNKKVLKLGSALSAPFMTLSFMSLLVIPSLKLSDKGLFDGNTFSFVPLFK